MRNLIRVSLYTLAIAAIGLGVLAILPHQERTPGQLHTARSGHTAFLLSNGKVLIIGGAFFKNDLTSRPLAYIFFQNPEPHLLDSAELYDPSTKSWALAGTFPNFSNGFILERDRLFAILDRRCSICDLKSDKLRSVIDLSRSPVTMHDCCKLKGGGALVIINNSAKRRYESFELDNQNWNVRAPASLNSAYSGAYYRLVPLENGDALAIDFSRNGGSMLYDHVNHLWILINSKGDRFSFECNVSLSDGRMLAIHTLTGHYEIFDPSLHVWSKLENVLSDPSLYGANAVRLHDGRVLFMTSICQIYDPATDKWTPTGQFNKPRHMFSATVLNDGTVLVAGGSNMSDFSLSSCELYNPITGKWSNL